MTILIHTADGPVSAKPVDLKDEAELEKVSAFQTGLDQLEKVTIFEKAQEIITTKNE